MLEEMLYMEAERKSKQDNKCSIPFSYNKFSKRIFEGLKRHFVETTGQQVGHTIPYGLQEMVLGGLSNEEFYRSRILASTIIYAGAGKFLQLGSDLFRWMFRVKKDSSEKYKGFVDGLYGFLFILGFDSFWYKTVVQVDDFDKAVPIILGRAVMDFFPVGRMRTKAVDIYRDLAHLKQTKFSESKNRTTYFRDLPKEKRLRYAIGGVALVAGLTYALPHLTPDSWSGLAPYVETAREWLQQKF